MTTFLISLAVQAAAAAKAVSVGQVMSNPFDRPPPPPPVKEVKEVAEPSFNPFAAPPPEPVPEPPAPEPVVEPEPEPQPQPEPEPEPEPAPVVEEPVKEEINPFAAVVEEVQAPARPPRAAPRPPPITETEAEAFARKQFDMSALPVKPAPVVADVPVPEREIGVLYEEHAHEVNTFNPFKEQKARREAPYNPFAPNAVSKPNPTAVAQPRRAAPDASASSAASAAIAAGPASSKKVPANNKKRPPPSREGFLEKQADATKLLFVMHDVITVK